MAITRKLSPAGDPEVVGNVLRLRVAANVPDRENEVVDPATIRLTQYKQNPIVLFGHDRKQHPIGKCETPAGEFRCWHDPAENALYQEWHFASTREAQQVAQLYREKVLRGASIGFLSDGLDDISPAEAHRLYGVRRRLKRHRGGDLLETSAVPVPSCPVAMAIGWVDRAKAAAVVRRGTLAGRPLSALVTKALRSVATRQARFRGRYSQSSRRAAVATTKAEETSATTAPDPQVPAAEDQPERESYGVKAARILAHGVPAVMKDAADEAAASDSEDVKGHYANMCAKAADMMDEHFKHCKSVHPDNQDEWDEAEKAAGEMLRGSGTDETPEEPEEEEEEGSDEDQKALAQLITKAVAAAVEPLAKQLKALEDDTAEALAEAMKR